MISNQLRRLETWLKLKQYQFAAHLFRPGRTTRVSFYLQLAVFSLEVNAIDHIDSSGLWAENSSFIIVKTWTWSLGGEADNTGAGAVCLTSRMSCIKKQTRVNLVHSADWIFNYRTGAVTHLFSETDDVLLSILQRDREEVGRNKLWPCTKCMDPCLWAVFNAWNGRDI